MWGSSSNDEGLVDTHNSNYIPLVAGGTFYGTPTNCTNYAQITCFAYSDVASATDGWSLELSVDGFNWDRKKLLTLDANASQAHTLAVVTKFFRVVFINGSSNQTEFRLQTILHKYKSKHLTSGADEIIPARADVELQRSVNSPTLDFSRGIITGVSTFHRFGRNTYGSP